MQPEDGNLTYAQMLSRLTPRQREILEHFLVCLNEARVAKRLGLAAGTVRNHVRDIIVRFHASGRTELVKLVLEAKQRQGDASG